MDGLGKEWEVIEVIGYCPAQAAELLRTSAANGIR
jgi:hypothetical protein